MAMGSGTRVGEKRFFISGHAFRSRVASCSHKKKGRELADIHLRVEQREWFTEIKGQVHPGEYKLGVTDGWLIEQSHRLFLLNEIHCLNLQFTNLFARTQTAEQRASASTQPKRFYQWITTDIRYSLTTN
jgi:hypothetical protein